MQNRLYLQRTKNALNQNKAISDEALLRLMRQDNSRRYVFGTFNDNDLGYPGVTSKPDVVDYEAYQQFVNDYMNARGNRMGIYPDGPSFSDPDIPRNYY